MYNKKNKWVKFNAFMFRYTKRGKYKINIFYACPNNLDFRIGEYVMQSTLLKRSNKTETEEKVTVALYARKSSKDDEEKSVNAQLHEMREYSEKKGWIISDEFVDNAKTGTNDNRPAFQNLLNQTLRRQEENEIQKIVVWKLDRFCRNRNDSRLYKAMLEKKRSSDTYNDARRSK